MAKKKSSEPKAPKKESVIDEDNLPIVSMDACEEFDPSGKKVVVEELSIENDDWDGDDDQVESD